MMDIETLCEEEFREGVSAGAAARQMCRSLPRGSKVREMLETMLAEANCRSFDRSVILHDFRELFPVAAQQSELRSFHRINGR